MTTKQITKPVAAGKAVAKPVAATRATAVRAVAKVVAKVADKTVAKAIAKPAAKAAPAPVVAVKATSHKEVVKSLFVLTDIARPQSGTRLFAHTVAAMSVLGMFGKGRPAVRKAALQAMVGATAISYHTKKKGTLVDMGDRIALTEFGASFFPARGYDKAEMHGFEKLFKTGDGGDVKVRAAHIVPVSMAI
jgi:hypothetical protein